MADDQALDGGTGTNPYTAAADDIGGVKYQRIKLRAADDGVAGSDVSAANPLPVVQTGTPTLPTGAATSALQTSEAALIGAVTETAPATDTASSGLNGRLQRAAQRLTSLIALLPASLGQKTMANGLAVTIASDQSAVPVSGTVTTTPPANASENVTQINGVAPLMGAGNTGTGSLRVTVATDQAVLPVSDNAGSLTVDAPVGTPIFTRLSSGSAALDPVRVDNAAFIDNSSHITPVGYYFDEVAGTALTENDAAVPRIDSKRAVINVLEDETTRGQRQAVNSAKEALVRQPAATTGAAPTAFTSTSSAQIFASNAARKLFTVYNNSDKDLYLMLASAAVSATSYHVIVKASGGFFSTSDYSGEIRGIMSAAIGTGQVNPGEYT